MELFRYPLYVTMTFLPAISFSSSNHAGSLKSFHFNCFFFNAYLVVFTFIIHIFFLSLYVLNFLGFVKCYVETKYIIPGVEMVNIMYPANCTM